MRLSERAEETLQAIDIEYNLVVGTESTEANSACADDMAEDEDFCGYPGHLPPLMNNSG